AAVLEDRVHVDDPHAAIVRIDVCDLVADQRLTGRPLWAGVTLVALLPLRTGVTLLAFRTLRADTTFPISSADHIPEAIGEPMQESGHLSAGHRIVRAVPVVGGRVAAPRQTGVSHPFD